MHSRSRKWLGRISFCNSENKNYFKMLSPPQQNAASKEKENRTQPPPDKSSAIESASFLKKNICSGALSK